MLGGKLHAEKFLEGKPQELTFGIIVPNQSDLQQIFAEEARDFRREVRDFRQEASSSPPFPTE